MVPAPGRLRQEDPEFEASVGYIVRLLSLKKIQQEIEETAQLVKCLVCQYEG